MADDLRQNALAAYQSGLGALPKYAVERQMALKGRVFVTFDQLLRRYGGLGLPAGSTLVDLGSADGSFVEVCRRNGLEACGLDAADGLDFEVDNLPLPDASADVVTSISVIEHLRSPARLLGEALRVLRAGGAIVVVCPNWRYAWREFYDDPTHVHPYSERSLVRALSNAGFSNVRVVPWIVCKPAWMWDLPKPFFVARWLIPFRGDAPRFIPSFLKGRSASLLALGLKK